MVTARRRSLSVADRGDVSLESTAPVTRSNP
jgi:hypothetical protein